MLGERASDEAVTRRVGRLGRDRKDDDNASDVAGCLIERVEEIDALRLVIEDLASAVQIGVTTGGPPSIRLSGPESLVARIQITPDGVIRRGSADWGDMSLTAEVPAGCPVEIYGRIGETSIGDIEGPLTLDLTAGGHVRAGRVSEPRVRIAGEGRVDLAAVTGARLELEVAGAGRITARADVDVVDAVVVGFGNIYVAGSARRAYLSVHGPGHINVGRVIDDLARSIIGSGNIVVTHPPVVEYTRPLEASGSRAHLDQRGRPGHIAARQSSSVATQPTVLEHPAC